MKLYFVISGDFNFCMLCRLETFEGSGLRFEQRRRRMVEAALGAAATLVFPGPTSTPKTLSLADLGGDWDGNGSGGEGFETPKASTSVAGAGFSGGVVGNPNRPTSVSHDLQHMDLGLTSEEEEEKEKEKEKDEDTNK